MNGRIQTLRSRLATVQSLVDRRQGKRDELLSRKAALEGSLAKSRHAQEVTTNVTVLLREAGDYARDQAREQVQAITTLALQSVFGTDYQFVLESGKQGNNASVTCKVISPYGDGETIETEGTDSRGGGLVDIQSLALRTAMLETARPPIDGPLLLDEPCKHVSEEYVPEAGKFLRESSATFDRQVIMVTHNDHLAGLANNVIRLTLKDGASAVA